MSGWKESEIAGDYRRIIRRAEKWLKDHEEDKKVDELLYQLKEAILEEDQWEADLVEEELTR